MSATNRGSERLKDDAYYTPFWCVDRLMEFLWPKWPSWALGNDVPWLEPCAGNQAIVKAFEANPLASSFGRRKWITNDINPFPGNTSTSDYLGWSEDMLEKTYTCVISNPPFSLAEEVIKKSLVIGRIVIMLLRTNFYGSRKRCAWLQETKPSILALPNRPSFALNEDGKPGADATEYGWFCWGVPLLRNEIHMLNETPPEDIKRAKQALLVK